MKSVRIGSNSGPHFPAFGLNTDQNNSEYGHFLRSDSFMALGILLFYLMIYNDKQSSIPELLEMDVSVSIHKQNLRFLAIEMSKIMKGSAPNLVSKMFSLKGRK